MSDQGQTEKPVGWAERGDTHRAAPCEDGGMTVHRRNFIAGGLRSLGIRPAVEGSKRLQVEILKRIQQSDKSAQQGTR
jgi:hypothetical protein